MAMTELRNVAEGDLNEFLVEDRDLFFVATIADGTQGVRRQRLGGVTKTSIPTELKAVRIYEELNRILAKRVDFNYFISRVADSFKQKLLEEIYTLWEGATADDFGGETYFPVAGTYSETALLDLIAHVEASAGGKPATIIGTKKALRSLQESIMSDGAKEEWHSMGYVGKFFGTPVVCIPQRHKVNSDEFAMSDDYLTIISGDEKPIKIVYEGSPLVIFGDPLRNADLTQEYFYAEKYGMGIVLSNKNSAGIGRYELA